MCRRTINDIPNGIAVRNKQCVGELLQRPDAKSSGVITDRDNAVRKADPDENTLTQMSHMNQHQPEEAVVVDLLTCSLAGVEA